MRVPEENNRSLSYRDLAPRLAEYVNRMNFTHVELLPVMEHPFYGSWGYETTGYFAPTARYGTPQDFMYLVEHLHQHGIGVILDWVPSHFPSDAHGLGYFDGTHLFEHADPRKGFQPDWKTYLFNYGRNEVRSFLVSSAMFWRTCTCGWFTGGRGGVNALSRLFTQAGGMASQSVRRAREIWRPLISCGSAIRKHTPNSLMCRPSPKSQRRGRWCRDRCM